MKTWIVAAVILCGLGISMAVLESSASKGDVLKATVAAIGNLLHFYKNNYDKSVNLDAVFGLRIIEGQLKLLVEDFNENSSKFAFSAASEVFSELRHVPVEATKVANMAIPHLVEQDPKYFELLKYLVQEPWKVSKPHRFINQNFSWNRHLVPPGSVPEMSEKVSDLCLAQLTGAKSSDKPRKPCDAITEECLRKFLQPQQFWYTLQHQILYTVVAQKMGCDKTIDEYVTARSPESISLDHLQHVFCTNAFLDLEEHVSRFGIGADFRDLFLEMQFICPSVGFFQFLRLQWLHKILEWQSPQGCFPADNKTSIVSSASVVIIKPHAKPSTTTTTTTTPSAVEPQHRNVAQPPPAYVPDNAKTARSWHESKPMFAQVHQVPIHPMQHYEPRKQIPGPVMDNVAPLHVLPPRLHHAVVARQDGMYPQNLPAAYHDAPMSPWGRVNGGYGMGQVPMNSHHPRANGWYGGGADVNRGVEERKDSPYQSEERFPDRGLKSVGVDGTLKRSKRSDEGIVAYHDNEVVMPQWRGLLREKSLEGGCLAHFTCVAAGALSMYLRYLLDPGPPEFSQHGLVNVWMSSHQPPKKLPQVPQVQQVEPQGGVSAKMDFLPVPQGPFQESVGVSRKGPLISGTYQRRWQLPVVGDVEVGKMTEDGMPSYVHRSGVRKNLEDRAVVLKKEGGNDTMTLERGTEGHEETLSDLQVEVRRMTLQSDLNHYLIIVTIVSLVCVCMLFKYIYKRRMYFKNRLRHL